MSAALHDVLRWLRPYRSRMALAAGLQTATIAMAIGLMATSAWLISAAALHPSIAALQLSIVGVRFFGIARGVTRYLERLVAHDVTLRILATLRVRIYDGLQPAVARLAGSRSGDILARLVADVETLEGVYVRAIGPTAAAAGVTVVMAVILWSWSGWLSAAAVTGLVAVGTLVPWLAWRLGSTAGRQVVGLRAEVAARVVDAVQGAADLAAFGRAATHTTATQATSDAMAHAQMRTARASSLGAALSGLGADLTAYAVLAAALALTAHGGFDPLDLALVTLATLAAFEAVSALPAAYQNMGAVQAAADRVADLIDNPKGTPAALAGAASAPAARRLDVRDLSFTYPGASRPALRGVSLRLEPGRPVAVVGASGSGKSTLAHLVIRLWDPPAGTILLDGEDITTLHPEQARAHIALVAQRTHLFAATLDENVRLGRPGARAEEVDDVVRRAGLSAVVEGLPGGLSTWLGEQGLRLSGGERQRLAIARALLKDAPILVCDEPTSHLDPEAAQLVLDEIYRLSADRGVLVITHQLGGLEPMAEIIVLEAGAVAERGTFATLAARDGPFARMLWLERDQLAV